MENETLEKREDGIYVVGDTNWGPAERKLNDEQVAQGKQEFEQKKVNLEALHAKRDGLTEELENVSQSRSLNAFISSSAISNWGPAERKLNDEQVAQGKQEFEQKK